MYFHILGLQSFSLQCLFLKISYPIKHCMDKTVITTQKWTMTHLEGSCNGACPRDGGSGFIQRPLPPPASCLLLLPPPSSCLLLHGPTGQGHVDGPLLLAESPMCSKLLDWSGEEAARGQGLWIHGCCMASSGVMRFSGSYLYIVRSTRTGVNISATRWMWKTLFPDMCTK